MLAKTGPFTKMKGAPPGLIGFLENIGAGNVRRHQVGRELNAVKLQDITWARAIDDGRLCQPGHTHEQAMAARQDADQQLLDDFLLADDDLGQLQAHFLVEYRAGHQWPPHRHSTMERRRLQ